MTSTPETGPDGRPILSLATAADWERWLDAEHESSSGAWLRLTKKNSAYQGPTYEDGLQVALCFGWIDGMARSYDEGSWLQRFTPRRRRSGWSRSNVDRVTALIESGRMRPAGQREIEAAKSDGRWDAALAG
ncbi:MAG TPA: hypothetical protein VEX15_17490 [Nocardioidaceae bacterium]|nr:hypothetical protein [Nocardioidaceae bacterium]